MKKNPELLSVVKNAHDSLMAFGSDLSAARACADTPALEVLLSQMMGGIKKEESIYLELVSGYNGEPARAGAASGGRSLEPAGTNRSREARSGAGSEDVRLLSRSLDRAVRQLARVAADLTTLSEVSLDGDFALNVLASQTLETVISPMERGLNNLLAHYQELAGGVPAFMQAGVDTGERSEAVMA